ncbi:uncharacterized protein [Primulina eburnea]|uniref:uncharacterized protein n=1 Tax=Primulina eburnea TaxID=1245227 RepID=UPI003C6C3E76
MGTLLSHRRRLLCSPADHYESHKLELPGLGNPRAFRELRRLIAEKDPTLLFLSETKMRETNCKHWKIMLGFSGCFMVDCKGKSGGLAMLWKELLNVSIKSFSSGHIDSIIQENGKGWRFTGFYGQSDVSLRHFSWNLLGRLKNMDVYTDLPWLVGGDFNEICYDSEKLGGIRRGASQMQAFRNILELCELQDIYCQDCIEVIKDGWGTHDCSLPVQERIESCKKALQGWATHRFRSIPKQLKLKRAQLNTLRTSSNWNASASQIKELEIETEKLASQEELYWRQRSRSSWLKDGDRNSRYFHATATKRKTQNAIGGLVSSHGDWCSDKVGLADIVLDYYKTLFTANSPSASDMGPVLDVVKPCVDDQMNNILGKTFSESDVRKALFDMHPDKAPGLDGMSPPILPEMLVGSK